MTHPAKAQSFESKPRTLPTHLPANKICCNWTAKSLVHLCPSRSPRPDRTSQPTPSSLIPTRRVRGLASGKMQMFHPFSPLETRLSGRKIPPEVQRVSLPTKKRRNNQGLPDSCLKRLRLGWAITQFPLSPWDYCTCSIFHLGNSPALPPPGQTNAYCFFRSQLHSSFYGKTSPGPSGQIQPQFSWNHIPYIYHIPSQHLS